MSSLNGHPPLHVRQCQHRFKWEWLRPSTWSIKVRAEWFSSMGGKSRVTSREIENTDKLFIALWVGFLMLMVTPCTDWYLVFTAVAKGNLALSTALLPVPLVLVVGPLIELPVLAVISQILLWMEPKRMRI